ncbi:hypothetical protein GTG28_20720 [Vibrio sp. OCN044]|uniref:Phage tail protein n=1 Tax=Vibrio tetraodonis subsp. pristinus TaxID=2695891 RepID=A0A6L8LZU4_9VIBR|nr:hypothetical protein [Vibrio tetraodonis]MYM61628.1 hypothetical protein [Vibrio tetraodonis subsp. pristinus]
MGKFTNYVKHGLSFKHKAPPTAISSSTDQLGLMVGTAPNKHDDVEYDVPFLLRSPDDVMYLDTTNSPTGSLFYDAKHFLETSGASLYVIVVQEPDEGASYDDDLKKAIVGGIHADTERRFGIPAIVDANEEPTVIGSTLLGNDLGVINALNAVAEDILCEVVCELPNTTTKAAKEFTDNFGDAYENVIGVDVSIERWGVPISQTAWGMAARCAVDPWVSPSNKPIIAENVARQIGHRASDSRSESNDLNSYGICVPIRPKRGGYVFWGNRTVTGAWISSVGLLNFLQRKLEQALETSQDEMMTLDFFEMEVERINNWIADLKTKNIVIHARAYLHQKLNSVNSYETGEWTLAIDYGEYNPNEHTVIFLQKDLKITREYVESAIKELG